MHVHFACINDLSRVVTTGQQQFSLGTNGHPSNATFPLVKDRIPGKDAVVRGRVELPTFRFSGALSGFAPVLRISRYTC
jgi:hypothetical protein